MQTHLRFLPHCLVHASPPSFLALQESALMPKLKYDHPVILKGAVQVFAHLVQKPMSPELMEVRAEP